MIVRNKNTVETIEIWNLKSSKKEKGDIFIVVSTLIRL